MTRTPVHRLLLLACGVLLTAPLLSATPAGADPVVAQPGGADPTDRAEQVLAEVEALLAGDGAGAATPAVAHDGSDLTLELRDLALLQEELPAAEQRQAAAYLSRPTDDPDDVPDDMEDVSHYTAREETPECSAVVCVHYVLRADDAHNGVRNVDTGEQYGVADNGVPDYVDLALAEMTRVHRAYVEAGYRAPEPDGVKGGNAKPDVYLTQIGDRGLYGYCTTDDPAAGNWTDHVGVYGYCVLDNDYRKTEFPSNTPRQNLQVTAAHEYFHNIQFGYDIAEDAWFMEATATWAEDELYDRVDDNVFYLPSGPIAKPHLPLDSFRRLYPYGAWIWIRFLTEKWDGETGSLPRIVRQMWEKADADEGPDHYSVQAIRSVLRARGTTVREQFVRFATVNRRARQHYAEGARNRYPVTPLAGSVRLTPAERSVSVAAEMDHLTSETYRFRAAKRMRSGWQLRLKLDLMPVRHGGAATYTVKPVGRAPVTRTMRLAADGDKVLRGIPFGRDRVKWVEVTIANGSTRYKCGTGAGWRFTCNGRARDDDRLQAVSAKAVRR